MDTAAVASARKQLAEFLAQYSPDDIYNFDETGFFYKLGPSSTLASEPVAGNKRSRENHGGIFVQRKRHPQVEAHCRGKSGATTMFWKDI